MTNSIKTTKANAVFLAAVLVAGIIALSYPSNLVGAQATEEYVMDSRYDSYKPDHGSDYGMDSYDDKKPYEKDNDKSTVYPSYGKDNSYDKSKDSSSVSVKKVKCNNINVNLNGFNGIAVNAVPPVLNSLATNEAQAAGESEVGTSSLVSGERNTNGYQNNDKNFRFVCVDNNNVQVPEVVIPQEPETCEECFEEFLTEDQIELLLERLNDIPSLPELCNVLMLVSVEEEAFTILLQIIEGESQEDIDIDALILCLKDVGVVFEQEPEP